jgi:hypothetical protein
MRPLDSRLCGPVTTRVSAERFAVKLRAAVCGRPTVNGMFDRSHVMARSTLLRGTGVSLRCPFTGLNAGHAQEVTEQNEAGG